MFFHLMLIFLFYFKFISIEKKRFLIVSVWNNKTVLHLFMVLQHICKNMKIVSLFSLTKKYSNGIRYYCVIS